MELWNLETALTETIITYKGWVRCLAVLPDGRVVSASQDDTVRLWDPQKRAV